MDDILELIARREGNMLEAKLAAAGLPESLWETYSAFANTCGGIILLGVEEREDRSLHAVGMPFAREVLDELLGKLDDRRVVSHNILPPGAARIVSAGGCDVIVIEVPRAPRRQQPVYIGADPLTGSYFRSEDGDYRCERREVLELLRQEAPPGPNES